MIHDMDHSSGYKLISKNEIISLQEKYFGEFRTERKVE
jgi:hypothetical protein